MKDRISMPIAVGDNVIVLNGYTYVLGVVIKFTRKRVTVDVQPYGESNYDPRNLVVFTAQHNYNLSTYPELYV